MKLFFLFLFIAFSFLSCHRGVVDPLFTMMKGTGIVFRNDVKDTKEENSFFFRNFYNGGGVALGDINNDGLPDVMFTSNQGENKLYLNKGGFRFEDISERAGLRQDSMWSTGVTMVDVNGDGWLDLYVCNSGHMGDGRRCNKLYINQGDNRFKEEGSKYGLDISGYCTQASFFDYDGDGDLDCFIINNSPMPFSSLNYAGMRDVNISNWKVDEKLKGGGNHLYRNDNGHFVEVTAEAGLHTGLISFGLGVSMGDINNDGYPDIYVGNDFIEKDYLYINQKNGTFKDELETRIQKISMSSMSSDLGDINNDGLPEIFTTDMLPGDDYRLKKTGTFDNIDLYLSKQKAGLYHQYVRNCLQLNNGTGNFSEIANYSGVSATDWSWGALFFDADNDGLNDIYVCNGIAKDVGDLDFLDFFSNEVYAKMLKTGQRMEMEELLKHIPVTPLSNYAFRNLGNLRFRDVAGAWGLGALSFSNGAAYGDLDGDGDLDLVVNNENGEAFVYRNNAVQQTGNHYIGVELRGSGLNSFAIGSKIKCYRGAEIFYREINPSRGFQSSVDYRQVIGLGQGGVVDSMVVIWPDRTSTTYAHPRLDTVYHLREPDHKGRLAYGGEASVASLLRLDSSIFDRHREDDYVDFYYERNLPEMLSREGPHIARGDVNGDGLEDVYIGGAKGQGGQLYLQQKGGGFVKKEEAVFKQYSDFEDVAVLFFDADGDGDLDLFVGAGGNNVHPGSREIQHRLYLNDGAGNFTLNPRAFPNNSMNISVAAAYDYDGDGDLDLFVGGRSVPYAYGVTPQSYLYQNDGRGNFSDVTALQSPLLSQVGMVTGAVWADVMGDGRKELVVTGEWMAPRVFKYGNKKFEEVRHTGLEQLYGWWQTLSVADVNGDGREDLILGNIGENFYLHPSLLKPVKLWVADFDGNGRVDQFITQVISGRDMPVFLKREVTDQFPGLKKENLRHSDYATKSIQDLFDKKTLALAEVKTFNYSASVVALSDGRGGFRVKELPLWVQLSSVNAICALDINGDGKTDLVTGGNLFTFPPQFGRLDGSYGNVLLGDGKGGFRAMDAKGGGLLLRGETKDIKEIKTPQGRSLLITQNNLQPMLYHINK